MSETRVTVKKNGPLIVEGAFSVCDASGAAFDLDGRTKISLCRCGLSENKPFCDGSHSGGFDSEVKARALPPPATKG